MLLTSLIITQGCLAKPKPYAERGLGGAVKNSGNVIIKNKSGEDVSLYKESHALVIGVSSYTNGWPALPGVKDDIKSVRIALEKRGFDVVTVLNPDTKRLDSAFEGFIKEYGGEVNNRLLFYFAGHGYTVKPKYGGSGLGYIVPTDAPNPHKNLNLFRQVAMSMQRIEEYALNIDSKHAIFLFDSCFSGSLFSISRAIPEDIKYNTAKPVRQFITSGSENETVPDVSIFRQMFVSALDGEADTDKDGYITGSELGYFMQKSVIIYSKGAQHPQYGKIRNPNLDKGDFVFASNSTNNSIPDVPSPTPPVVHPRDFSLHDLETQAEWSLELIKMKKGFKDVKSYQDSSYPSNLKVTAWQRFIKRFSEDNPYTDEDSSLLKEAKKNLKYWETREGKKIVISKEAGNTLTNSIDMKFAYIPTGTFIMGSDSGKSNEMPVHSVTIGGFYMQTTEVTQKQWEEVMGNNPSHFSECGDGCPVEQVSWNDAHNFIKNINEREGGEKYRLPTEAEWEYACRAGSTTKYSYGDSENELINYAWYVSNSEDETHSVGEKKPNAWGLYDMNGNVWEWCNGLYEKYTSVSSNNPVGSAGGNARITRGGSWTSYPQYLRSSYRSSAAPAFRFYNIGFRLVRKP